jgi:hypothetical protein
MERDSNSQPVARHHISSVSPSLEYSEENEVSNGSAAPGAARNAENSLIGDLQDPDLSAIIQAWSRIPPVLRAGILAMVKAAGVVS